MTTYANPTLIVETAKVEPGSVTWKSPSNIALIKYWGKHGIQLPRNPSISFTLESAFSQTMLSYEPRKEAGSGISLDFYFHDAPNEAFKTRVVKYLESLLDIFPFLKQFDLTLKTANSFPHGAGIASSASGMSALALCLCSMEDELFDTLGDDAEFDRKASYVARLGSGSACRSIFPTMAVWGESGEIEGSSDLYAIPFGDHIHEVYKSFHNDILIVGAEEKAVSSSAGHALMEGNPFAPARYQQARQRLHNLLPALKSGDLETFGKIVEDEALTLHALMMASNPSYILMRPNTLQMIELLRAYRAETNHPVYFTLDAGPNLHVLYPESIIHKVRPFIESELTPLCEEGLFIPDWVGEGPEQL